MQKCSVLIDTIDRPQTLEGVSLGVSVAEEKLSPKHPCGFRSVMCLLFPHHPFPSVPAVIFPFVAHGQRPAASQAMFHATSNKIIRFCDGRRGGLFSIVRASIRMSATLTCGEKMFACAASEKLVLVLSCSQPSLRESCRGRYIRKCGGPCRPASHQTDKDDPGEAVSRVLVVSDRPGDHRIRD